MIKLVVTVCEEDKKLVRECEETESLANELANILPKGRVIFPSTRIRLRAFYAMLSMRLEKYKELLERFNTEREKVDYLARQNEFYFAKIEKNELFFLSDRLTRGITDIVSAINAIEAVLLVGGTRQ